MPSAKKLAPGYEQKFFSDEERTGRLRLIASEDGSEGSVRIHQDARLYAAFIDAGETLTHELKADRFGWLQVARGSVGLNDLELGQGDGAAISQESELKIAARDQAEVLLFDLA
jgi:redox-sensitive bicupin YhaK (pirin superfamily)